MTRRFFLTAAVVLVAVCTTVSLGAQGRGMGRGGPGGGIGQRMGGPGGPGEQRGRGPGGPGGGVPFLQGLKLTDEQREQVRAIMEETRTETPPEVKMHELQSQLQLAILADAADAQAIDTAKAQVSAAEAEMLAHRVSVEARIAQILTPEQRAQARAEVGKRRIGGQ